MESGEMDQQDISIVGGGFEVGIARKGSMIVVDKEEEILKSGLDIDSLSLPSLVPLSSSSRVSLSLPHSFSFSFSFCGQPWDGTGGTGGTGGTDGSVHI